MYGHAREKEVKVQAEARERDIFTARQLCMIREYSQSGTQRVTQFMYELIDHQGKN